MRQLPAVLFSAVLIAGAALAPRAGLSHPQAPTTRPVSGKAVHYFTTAMIHSATPTPTGKIQRSTDIIELTGGLKGRVLYHPTSVIDTVKRTLVNTGSQVFSGTVLGSEPVMLYDDRFRFEVELKPGGRESGEVHLSTALAGPKISCDLIVGGKGVKTPEGNGVVDYSGTCKFEPGRATRFE